MNRPTMVFAAAMMAAMVAPAFGQSDAGASGDPPCAAGSNRHADIGRIEANYLACLDSRNDAVVESAIAQTVRMKWAFSSDRLGDLKEALSGLAGGGRTVAIRYKAYLAELVFECPSLFTRESREKFGEDDELFSAISGRLQTTLIGYNSGRASQP